MSSFGLFILCLLVPLGFGMWAQHKVKSTFRRYAEVPEDSGMNGAQIAERILIANGLTDVPVRSVPRLVHRPLRPTDAQHSPF